MSILANITAVMDRMRDATSYPQVFGALPSGDLASQKFHIKRKFGYLARIVHPDYAPGFSKEAGEAFRMLNELREHALRAIEAGTYDKPFRSKPDEPASSAPNSAACILRSATNGYQLHANPYMTGDFSVIYRAVDEAGAKPVLVKIASLPEHNAILENEVRIVKRFLACKDMKRFVPEITDTFLVSGDVGKKFRATVMPFTEGYITLTEILKAFPKGLDPRDAAWIWRRVLGQTLAASGVNVVHGAIVPDHVLVHPVTHEPLHIGWAHAIIDPKDTRKRVTMVIERWRDWYPPEVFDKQLPTHQLDIFMAGKTMIALLGGDTKRNSLPSTVPAEIKRIVMRCVEKSLSSRADSGREILDAFTAVIKKLWGLTYRRLNMPGC